MQVKLHAHTKSEWFSPRVQKPSQFPPPTQHPNQFHPYTEIKSNSIAHSEIKSKWTTYSNNKSILMFITKASDFQPAYKWQINFYHPHNNQIAFIPALKSSQIRYPTLRSSQFRPPWKITSQYFHAHTKNKYFSTCAEKQGQFWPPHKKHLIFDPHTKTKSIYIPPQNQVWTPTLKSRQFRSPHYKQVIFAYPDTNTKFSSIQTQHKLFSTSTPNQVSYDPYTEIRSTSIPHSEITSISTTHTTIKSMSMPTLTPCHFRAVLLRVLHIPEHVFVIQQQYV